MKYGFGVDLGGTTVKLAFFTQEGNLLDKWEIPTVIENGGKQILPDIATSIREYLQNKKVSLDEILGVGIGVPGAVRKDGMVNHCYNLGWGVFNIEKELSRLTGLSVKAGNDANVAALGECWKGSGRGSQNLVFVTLGTGVGGGIVQEGRVLYGAHGSGGEIGHMVIHREETEPCSCGKYGCVEQYCSAKGIVRLAKKGPLGHKENLTCKDVFDAAKKEDPAALAVLDQVYRFLGEALANVCDVVNPEMVVLGGGVSKAGQMIIDGLMPWFQKSIFPASSQVRFSIASLGNDAGVYGAFKLILGE